MPEPPLLAFERGTLVLPATGWDGELARLLEGLFALDARTGNYRAPALCYAETAIRLHRAKIPFRDGVRRFERRRFNFTHKHPPRPYQVEALQKWIAAERRGVVVLPTGTGKSLLACLAIEKAGRDTLVIVPTLDLLEQWRENLKNSFAEPVGVLGGGRREVHSLTVSTYDSALPFMEHQGGRFGFLVADECHHLPSPASQWIARMSAAPFRLGLTATPDRADGGEALLGELLGPLVYARGIEELAGPYLSHYATRQVLVPLSAEEAKEYRHTRAQYLGFARTNDLKFDGPEDWSRFLATCMKSEEGRSAYRAYRRQRSLALSAQSKMEALFDLLRRHRHERALVFTDDNATAYHIAETFLLPVITHHTSGPERRALLDDFRKGTLPVLVTSRVLNEGVDVPEASVGIVVSGSGSVREHVQRLGRILRKVQGKRAVLYELVSAGTGEFHQSRRRRNHRAYQRTAAL